MNDDRQTTATDHGEGRRLAAFDVSLRPISGSDADLRALHELSVGVSWPHRLPDIRLLTQIGTGYIMADDIGRPLGSGMVFPIAAKLCSIGMMITAPRLQAIGAGRWMLDRLMGEAGVDRFMLNATRSGYKLYATAGFQPVRNVQQHQGRVRQIYLPDAVARFDSRDLIPADLPAIRALDAEAHGVTRSVILDRLLPCCTGRVVMEGSAIRGYALMRNFGRGKLIGPIVAGSTEMVKALIAPLFAQNTGQFMRVDTPMENSEFNLFLGAMGLGIYDTVYEMQFGQTDPITKTNDKMQVFALAAQALG